MAAKDSFAVRQGDGGTCVIAPGVIAAHRQKRRVRNAKGLPSKMNNVSVHRLVKPIYLHPDLPPVYSEYDRVLSVNGYEIQKRNTMYRLIHDIYPGALAEFRFAEVENEDDILLRPRVRRVDVGVYQACARLIYDNPSSKYVAYFATWRDAMLWTKQPCAMVCPCRIHTDMCTIISRTAKCR